jgi:exodeoxyribonuclease VIII
MTEKPITFEQYRAIQAVNFSTLKHMAKSPLHYRHAVDVGFEDKASFALGRVCHTAVLEPFSWLDRYMIKPDEVVREKFNKRTKETTTETLKLMRRDDMPEWVELQAKAKVAGKEIITRDEHDKAVQVARSVLLNQVTADLFRQKPLTEVSIVWECRGLPMKSRLDIVIPGKCIVDLKSTGNIEPEAFDRSVISFEYLAQGAFYQDAWFHKTGEMLPFLSMPVEAKEPFDVDLVEFEEADTDEGRDRYQGWVDKVIECRKSGDWPGVNPTKSPRKFVRPPWAYPEEDDEIVAA